MSEADNSDLRRALSQFATGVTIVTATDEQLGPVGVTANSFSSISLEPPMVLWSLSASAFSRKSFERSEHFCVHVLTAGQQSLSERFACAGADKFAGVEWMRGIGEMPLLTEYVARFQCRTTDQYRLGDHVVFVGKVLDYRQTNKRPLVYHGGRYAHAERRLMSDLARELQRRTSDPAEGRARRKTAQ